MCHHTFSEEIQTLYCGQCYQTDQAEEVPPCWSNTPVQMPPQVCNFNYNATPRLSATLSENKCNLKNEDCLDFIHDGGCVSQNLQAVLPPVDLGVRVLDGLICGREASQTDSDVVYSDLQIRIPENKQNSVDDTSNRERLCQDCDGEFRIPRHIEAQKVPCSCKIFCPEFSPTRPSCKSGTRRKATKSFAYTNVLDKLKTSRLKRISDVDLMRLTVSELLCLGHAVGIPDKRIQILKARRRRLNNRKSACGSARRRRTELQQMLKSNDQLSKEHATLTRKHTLLQRQHRARVTEEQKEQVLAAAALETNRELALKVEQLRNYIQRLDADSVPEPVPCVGPWKPKISFACQTAK
eukprot:m.28422 g.28422  ORF g.28422 m.28422 type:complete len:353 (-) comp13589_c0_seq6:5275-6333(-)